MTTPSEYGLVTPVRGKPRPTKPNLGLDGLAAPAPRPLYPEPTQPVPPKPPYPEAGVTPIPPADPSPTVPNPPKPTPIPPASPSPTVPNPPKPPAPVPPVTGSVPPVAGQLPATGAPPTPGSLGLDFMRQVTPNELVSNQLNTLLDQNGAYMRNARLRGQEQAASRGLLNSSVAAGASQRAALEAAAPIAQADADVYRQANQGNFESLSQLRQMRTAADLENWLGSESYNRDFNGRLAMLPIQSSMDMLSYIQQRAMEDPAVYTPDVISGMNNFFNYNMFDIMNSFFGTGGGGG